MLLFLTVTPKLLNKRYGLGCLLKIVIFPLHFFFFYQINAPLVHMKFFFPKYFLKIVKPVFDPKLSCLMKTGRNVALFGNTLFFFVYSELSFVLHRFSSKESGDMVFSRPSGDFCYTFCLIKHLFIGHFDAQTTGSRHLVHSVYDQSQNCQKWRCVFDGYGYDMHSYS